MIESLLTDLGITDVNILAHDYGDTVTQELIARFNAGITSINIRTVTMLNGGIFPNMHVPVLSQRLLRLPIIGTILAKFSNYYAFRVTLSEIVGPSTEFSEAELHDAWR